MFSGIVEELGEIAVKRTSSLQIGAKLVLENTKIGDSIAVNGVCLTVTMFSKDTFCVDVAPETLRRTNLGSLALGSFVNLERSLSVGDRIGGHFVQGHVDTTVEVSSIKNEGNAHLISFRCPENIMRYIVEKGYVAIDGMSLTVISPQNNTFAVSFIPHTFTHTLAGNYYLGRKVNLEVDILGKYVEKMVGGRESNITKNLLEKHGFA